MKIIVNGSETRLRRLSDAEYDEATKGTKYGTSLCPTCENNPKEAAEKGVIPTYRLWGQDVPCDCAAQITLWRHYTAANIGEEYMRLDWDWYVGDDESKEAVDKYLESWKGMKFYGIGLEFTGPLGTGKTFAATHIAKELIEQGQLVYFMPFISMVSAFERDDAERIEDRMRDATFLVLDEILPPVSSRQHELFATRLEALIRHRTNNNLPTITGTNLSEEELDGYYPRTYSLLAANQTRVYMAGDDARRGWRGKMKLELAINNERTPIT